MADLKAGLAYPSETVARYLADGSWNDETPQHWLAEWAESRPDAPAAIGTERTLNYGELHERALRFANGLLKVGLRKGDRVGVQLPNLPEFLIAYHGIQMMGAVITLLHMPYREGELAPLLNHGEVGAVICHGGLGGYDAPGTMLALKDRVPTLRTVIVQGGEAPVGTVAFDELFARADPIPEPPVASDPAVLAFTSGTSAAPKAAVHANRSLACSHRALSVDCGLGPDDVVLSAPPFTHIYGLCVANIALTCRGGKRPHGTLFAAGFRRGDCALPAHRHVLRPCPRPRLHQGRALCGRHVGFASACRLRRLRLPGRTRHHDGRAVPKRHGLSDVGHDRDADAVRQSPRRAA